MTDYLTPTRTETGLALAANVGAAPAPNRPDDVRAVQQMLNANRQHLQPFQDLADDGQIGPKTLSAIEKFQRTVMLFSNPDRLIEVNGKTHKKLVSLIVGGAPPAAPVGAFTQRLQVFQNHVQTTYSIWIAANSEFRTAETQNRWHIAHMIRFNSFPNMRPAQSEVDQGRNVISLNHLSNATLVWGAGLDYSEYLRDQMNMPCRKTPDGRQWVNAPQAANTRARAQALLAQWGIGTPRDRNGVPIGPANSAKVAPGVAGCVEPCRCGGGRSNHVAGMAADLDRNSLDLLRQRLTPPTDASLAALLLQFGLHRPVGDEPWHVEAT